MGLFPKCCHEGPAPLHTAQSTARDLAKLSQILGTEVGDLMLFAVTPHRAANRQPTPLKNCTLSIADFQIWSEGLKQFSVIKGFDGSGDLVPMRIYGPTNLYTDDPVSCDFIQSTSNKELVSRSLEPQRFVKLQRRDGIWRADLRLEMDGQTFTHCVCFEWKLGEKMSFVQCPDFSLADF
ncbi:MAG TPA: hypothetical protein VLA99_07550 [Nitrospiraceae bacterium]|nr:hypothetical protein [Nitrospiraceae bacterium]